MGGTYTQYHTVRGPPAMFDSVSEALGPGIQPLPELQYTGNGYGIKGVQWKQNKQGHCCSTNGGSGDSYHVRGSKLWLPSMGPDDDAIAHGLANHSESLN